MKHQALLTGCTALAVVLAPAAFAQDADVQSGDTGIRLTVSGQVNRAILSTDDGEETDTFFVDNDNSSTRLRFTGVGDLSSTARAGFNIEVQIESNSTADVNQLDESVDSDGFSERKLEVFFEDDRYGRISLGQGDMASNGTSEQDLSGTGVVGYSGVADLAGGILFRRADGTLSDTSVGDAFSNLDGQSRRDRIRYDTPSFAGFSAAASYGEDDRRDIALFYDSEISGVAVNAALAYSQDDDENERINGSVSALHLASGLSFTFAGGEDYLDDKGGTNVGQEPHFNYLKLGWQTDALVNWGTSAFAVDYFYADDMTGREEDSTSYGLLFVQNIDRIGTELYAGLRRYELDSDDPAVDYEDIDAVIVGARVKF